MLPLQSLPSQAAIPMIVPANVETHCNASLRPEQSAFADCVILARGSNRSALSPKFVGFDGQRRASTIFTCEFL